MHHDGNEHSENEQYDDDNRKNVCLVVTSCGLEVGYCPPVWRDMQAGVGLL
jgi:hypothetical protein